MAPAQMVHPKSCPRCGSEFVCTHDINCQCVGITLTDSARAYLRTHSSDCLCRNCLIEISNNLQSTIG